MKSNATRFISSLTNRVGRELPPRRKRQFLLVIFSVLSAIIFAEKYVPQLQPEIVTGTYTWSGLNTLYLKCLLRFGTRDEVKPVQDFRTERIRDVRQRLEEIRSVALAHNCCFRPFLIPCRPSQRSKFNSIPLNQDVFAGFDPTWPTNLTEAHYYGRADSHLNNKGQRIFADFVLRELRDETFPGKNGNVNCHDRATAFTA